MSWIPQLHVASSYSARYGVSDPDDLVAAAVAGGADVAAVTDRDGLYGAIKHVSACVAAGVDAVVGVDLAVLDEAGGTSGRVVVLAHGRTGGAGWAGLCRLISAAHEQSPVGLTRARLAVLAGEECTVLLGPDSDVGRLVTARRLDAARRALSAWRGVTRHLVVQVVDLLTEPGTELSLPVAVRMSRLGAQAGLPVVLGNAVRYAGPSGARTADVLDAARHLTDLEHAPLQANAQAWLKDGAAMREVAHRIAAAGGSGSCELVGATRALADRCRLDPDADLGWGRPRVPEAAVLGLSGDPQAALTGRCRAGVDRLWRDAGRGALRRAHSQLEHELAVIAGLGFAGYFLTVAAVTDLIRELGIHASARGSGVGSLAVHALGVSAIDPLEHRLVFERFLSPLRRELPDIDLDIESARRHEAYHAIFDRFGAERVTLMSMMNAYRARGAVRDAGRALGIAAHQIDDVATSLWRVPGARLGEAIATRPELVDLAEAVRTDEQLAQLVDVAGELDRLPRHTSMHPCGVILSDASLLGRTPVQPAGAVDLLMSQYDKWDMDPMGLLKLDVLGVRMQSAMAHAVAEVRRTTGERIDLDRLPLADEPTFEAVRSTHTLGMFQIESPGQRELVGKLQPEDFEDLVIDISLFRPGPMKADMITPLLNRRDGWEEAAYLHPRLRHILEPTQGIVVFHEQIIDILDVVTGCGRARADVLRRALEADGDRAEVERLVRTRGAERGFASADVDEIWRVIAAFGSFGFCRAHAAAFALTTWQSAWLKTHHPAAFMAGLLEHDPGMYPRRLLLAEARRMGVPLWPLDVNRSTEHYRLQAGPDGRVGVRLALTEVRGMSRTERARLVAAQPFDSLTDLVHRARPARASLGALAQVGALDGLYSRAGRPVTRRDLIAHVQSLVARPVPPSPALPGQGALSLPRVDLPALPAGGAPTTPAEATEAELAVLGLDVSGHVLDPYRPLLRRLGVTPAAELLGRRSGSLVLVAGIRVATGTPPMRRGHRTVFISLDDGSGVADAVVFADAQQRIGPLLFRTRMLLVRGRTRRTGRRGISLTAEDAWDLAALDPDATSLPAHRSAARAPTATASGHQDSLPVSRPALHAPPSVSRPALAGPASPMPSAGGG